MLSIKIFGSIQILFVFIIISIHLSYNNNNYNDKNAHASNPRINDLQFYSPRFYVENGK